MADLHALLAEIERREAIAREAVETFPGGWTYDHRHLWVKDGNGTAIDSAGQAVGAYMVDNQPADALRRYAHYRRILDRHEPVNERPYRHTKCRHTAGSGVSYMVEWPCPEIRDLAAALGAPWEPAQPNPGAGT